MMEGANQSMSAENKNSENGIDEVPKDKVVPEVSTHKGIHGNEELYASITPEEIREFNRAKEIYQTTSFAYNLFLSIITLILIFVSNYFVNAYILWMAKILPIPEEYLPTIESVLRAFDILLFVVFAISCVCAVAYRVYKKQKERKYQITSKVTERETKLFEDINKNIDEIIKRNAI